MGKLRPKKNEKPPQGHTMAEQVKEILIVYATSHIHSSKMKLRIINIRKGLNQQLLNLKNIQLKALIQQIS